MMLSEYQYSSIKKMKVLLQSHIPKSSYKKQRFEALSNLSVKVQILRYQNLCQTKLLHYFLSSQKVILDFELLVSDCLYCYEHIKNFFIIKVSVIIVLFFVFQKTELKLENKDYKEIQRDTGDDVHYWNRTVGLYLVIEASNGVMLIWDKKTTVFIKLTPDYKVRTCLSFF